MIRRLDPSNVSVVRFYGGALHMTHMKWVFKDLSIEFPISFVYVQNILRIQALGRSLEKFSSWGHCQGYEMMKVHLVLRGYSKGRKVTIIDLLPITLSRGKLLGWVHIRIPGPCISKGGLHYVVAPWDVAAISKTLLAV